MDDIALGAVRNALKRLGHPDVTEQDFEDMAQEAHLAIWRCRDESKALEGFSSLRPVA
jgi:DNA-directed RNA polymerase specialized sigma24 family protein